MQILVGYNGSVESKAAVRLAGELAGPLGAKVQVMTSMPGGPRERPEDIASAEAHLKEAQQIMASRGVSCEVFQSVRGLSPGEDLVDYAKEKAVELIVVGVEKRSKTQKILLGSTAQYIILKAPCPVLTVK
ncbi:MAG: universal stress protein [Desulfobacteraceae bacterium]|jgi:nucleotide-binding universal stress UspA family protein|nr:universal stress protein [Desulfobacteraceae bacterium]